MFNRQQSGYSLQKAPYIIVAIAIAIPMFVVSSMSLFALGYSGSFETHEMAMVLFAIHLILFALPGFVLLLFGKPYHFYALPPMLVVVAYAAEYWAIIKADGGSPAFSGQTVLEVVPLVVPLLLLWGIEKARSMGPNAGAEHNK